MFKLAVHIGIWLMVLAIISAIKTIPASLFFVGAGILFSCVIEKADALYQWILIVDEDEE